MHGTDLEMQATFLDLFSQ